MIISSRQNALFKKLISLTKSKGIREHGQCLVSGEKLTSEISQQSLSSFWITTEKLSLPEGSWDKTICLSQELFDEVDVCGTHKPLLCVETPKAQSYEDLNNNNSALFCGLGDPNNLGALIRTSMAFKMEQMVLLKESSNPFLPKAIRASSGACFQMSFYEGPSIKDLKRDDLMALDMNGSSLSELKLPSNIKILIGQEGQGVPQNFNGQRIHLPISEKVESLNATVAASLFIYHWSQL